MLIIIITIIIIITLLFFILFYYELYITIIIILVLLLIWTSITAAVLFSIVNKKEPKPSNGSKDINKIEEGEYTINGFGYSTEEYSKPTHIKGKSIIRKTGDDRMTINDELLFYNDNILIHTTISNKTIETDNGYTFYHTVDVVDNDKKYVTDGHYSSTSYSFDSDLEIEQLNFNTRGKSSYDKHYHNNISDSIEFSDDGFSMSSYSDNITLYNLNYHKNKNSKE